MAKSLISSCPALRLCGRTRTPWPSVLSGHGLRPERGAKALLTPYDPRLLAVSEAGDFEQVLSFGAALPDPRP